MATTEQALHFAESSHKGQTRNDGKTPYINHCIQVANMVRDIYGDNDVLIKAAYLHDTLEDTDVSYEDILEEFGAKVAQIVFELTNNWDDHTDWVEKLGFTHEHLRKMSDDALKIKVIDRICNLREMRTWTTLRKSKYITNSMVIATTLLQMKKEDLYIQLLGEIKVAMERK